MASEGKRGCGYRSVGSLYLCGEGIMAPCDRLPYELTSCPVCGAGIHFTRSMTLINPLKLFGIHDGQGVILEGDVGGTLICRDKIRPCLVCDPTEEPAYIMTVGRQHYTPDSFLKEASIMGISKKIAQIPKHLELGKTIVYLAHPDAKQVKVESTHDKKGNNYLIPKDEYESRLAIFSAFIPKSVEMPCWEKQLKGKGSRKLKADLKKRNITAIPIRDGDKDHK